MWAYTRSWDHHTYLNSRAKLFWTKALRTFAVKSIKIAGVTLKPSQTSEIERTNLSRIEQQKNESENAKMENRTPGVKK